MSKYYVFTTNNYITDDLLCIRSLVGRGVATYVVFAYEVAPTTGTRHLQGYLELPQRRRMGAVIKLMGGRSSLQPRKGTALEARDYCLKLESEVPNELWEEYGAISTPEQGRRNDLEALHQTLQEQKSLVDISDLHFGSFCRYERSIRSYKRLRIERRTWQPEVIVYWGLTGTGKTSRVYQECDNDVWAYPGGGWFDSYDGEDNVLFDEFTGSEFKLPYLLKLLDRYPMQVPFKGGFVQWKPRKIYITANFDPAFWFPNARQEHVDALFRRITSIEKIE